MLTEKGTLPFGIEHEGAVYREYTLREQLVRDAVEVFDSADAERAGKSDSYYGVCIMARRLSIVGLPPAAVSTERLMDMSQTDFNELAAADKRLAEKRRSFRGAAEAAAKTPTGTAEAGV